MRATAVFVGGVLALAAVLTPITPPPSAYAVTVPVNDADALVTAFAAASGTDTVIELGASITVTPSDGSVGVPDGATVTLDMNGKELSVAGAAEKAAISVNAGSTLHIIDSDDAGTSILRVIGGEFGAGLGGDQSFDSGKIIIDGVAQIFAQGGRFGAGIGGGGWGSNGEVVIFGGTIQATGGDVNAAGIGGGVHSHAGTITIYDGTITAEGATDEDGSGAGIGGAGNGKSGLITILGGDVTAIGHGTGAGIGGGGASGGTNEGEITIAGGTVVAVGGETGGSGVGSGFGRLHGPVHISDATVIATGGGCSMYDPNPAPAIGHSGRTAVMDRMAITIHNADVTAYAPCATSTQWAAAIGGGESTPGADVIITGDSTVTVDAPGSLSAIGAGSGVEQYFGSLDLGPGAELGVEPGSALVIPQGATVTNAGTLWAQGSLTNYGVMSNSGGLRAFDGLINYGEIVNSELLVLAGTGTENYGLINNSGELVVIDGLVNDGIIRGAGYVDGVERITHHNFINRFHANDGSGSTISTETVLAPDFASALLALPEPPTRSGFDFIGWNTAPDGSGELLEVGTQLGTSATTFDWFAQWQAQAVPQPTPAAGESSELARGGQDAPTVLIAGIAVLFTLGATLMVGGRARRIRMESLR